MHHGLKVSPIQLSKHRAKNLVELAVDLMAILSGNIVVTLSLSESSQSRRRKDT